MNDKDNSLRKKIFISYSHQDHICARGIARFLLRQNFDVWIDADKLIAGQNWAGKFQKILSGEQRFCEKLQMHWKEDRKKRNIKYYL